jgi:hypothetical protein
MKHLHLIFKKIDYDDKEFQKIFSFYYLNSFPYGDADSMKTISSRVEGSKALLEDLRSSDLSLCVMDDDDYMFFTFFKKEKDGINLSYAFPNQLTRRLGTLYICLCFYKQMLEAFDYFGVNEIYGDIERVFKKANYRNWLKRHLKVRYEDNKDGGIDRCYFPKKEIKEHYEELQIKNNRNKLDNKTS